MIPWPWARSYDRGVMRMASRLAGFPQSLAMWLATLPARRQELVQDLAFGIALGAVNVVSL